MVEDDCSNQYKRDHMERWMFSISVKSKRKDIKDHKVQISGTGLEINIL